MLGQVIVDAARGSDAQGGRFGGSVRTLARALALAVSGDVIMVSAGTYAEIGLTLKTGVNWFFCPGAKVTYTGTSHVSMFTDGGVACTCVIDGAGEFRHVPTGTDTSLGVQFGIITTNNAASNVTFRAKSLSGEWDDTAGFVVNAQQGTLTVECVTIFSLISGGCIGWLAGELYVKARKISVGGGGSFAYTIWGSGAGNFNSYIEADLIENPGYGIIHLQGGSVNFKMWVKAKEMRGTLGGVTTANITCEGGKLYVQAQKLNSFSACGVLVIGGECWVNFDKMTADTATANGFPSHMKVTGGVLRATVQHIEQVAGTVQHGFEFSAGTAVIQFLEAIILNGPAIKHNGGNIRFVNARIETQTNLAANNCATLTANGLTLHNCLLVCPALALPVSGAFTAKCWRSYAAVAAGGGATATGLSVDATLT
jgi:hypothetical protein